ncbi:octapeptide-repeat protein T2-like [Entelurus aequoreus]|uniref:octapeptide-repeat protein T2-like n=1 Tax=Entelurus aequoreus TaxID=161455 RepID=UPI002B1E429A|nr:octapeptide-repeat protein T2-like [Entelurus aequoreus]
MLVCTEPLKGHGGCGEVGQADQQQGVSRRGRLRDGGEEAWTKSEQQGGVRRERRRNRNGLQVRGSGSWAQLINLLALNKSGAAEEEGEEEETERDEKRQTQREADAERERRKARGRRRRRRLKSRRRSEQQVEPELKSNQRETLRY